jgi:outer membrane protein TolC
LKPIRHLYLILIALAIVSGKAQEQFSLHECLNFTLQNSPKIHSEKLTHEKEVAEIEQQKSAFLPSVDAFVNYNHFFNDLPTYIFPQEEGSVLAGETLMNPYPVQLGLPHNLNTGLQLSQTIFDMRFFGNDALMQSYRSYNEIRLNIVEEEILYQVAQLFYQVAVNKERLEFLQMNLDRLAKLQDIVKLQAEQGFAKQTDYEKLIVKTSNLQSSKNKLQSGIRQQVRYLKLMMGMDQDQEINISYHEDPLLEITPASLEKGEMLEVEMIQQQKQLYDLRDRKQSAQYYPQLKAYASLLFQAQRQQFNFFSSNQDWYNIHQWGIKLSIPILNGFERRRKMQVSEIVEEQLSFGLQQKHVQNELEFENAVSDLEVARAEEQAQASNVRLAERVYRQSELSYEHGTMLLMDFLDATSTLRESKMIYATAVLDTKLAELNILKASGNLNKLVNQ